MQEKRIKLISWSNKFVICVYACARTCVRMHVCACACIDVCVYIVLICPY